MLKRHFVLLALLCSAAIAAGCGSSNRPTFPVKGKVTYNGEPLTTGTVTFAPIGGGPPAYGEINKEGIYQLTTFEENDGAIPGTHRVMVSALKDNGPGVASSALIPDKYSGDQSGLEATVKDDGENIVDLPLTGRITTKAPVAMP